MDPYIIELSTPTVSTYLALRRSAGLSPKSEAGAAVGLKNSLFSVQVILDDRTVGMGRVVGDGGCFFSVVDIAVEPSHQGKGLGKAIMGEIKKWVDENIPASGHVSLLADGQAQLLYEKFGFKLTAPVSVGMALPVQH